MFTRENNIMFGIAVLEVITLFLMKTETPVAIVLVLYAIVGYGLRYLVRTKGLMAGNVIYDFIGIIGTSIIAILFFNEKATLTTYSGLALGGVSLYLLSK